jgi:BarA-like signal transduction histidine kinase
MKILDVSFDAVKWHRNRTLVDLLVTPSASVRLRVIKTAPMNERRKIQSYSTAHYSFLLISSPVSVECKNTVDESSLSYALSPPPLSLSLSRP